MLHLFIAIQFYKKVYRDGTESLSNEDWQQFAIKVRKADIPLTPIDRYGVTISRMKFDFSSLKSTSKNEFSLYVDASQHKET